MANDTVEASPPCNGEMFGLFDQAFRALGDSVKVAMKAQEDTVKFWGEAVGKANPVQAVAGELIPTAQKNADEYLKLMETSYRRNADLLKKAMHPAQNGSDSAALEKNTREWWEASMEVARDNAQDLMNTNLRVAQAWTEVFKKGSLQKAAMGK